MSNVEIHGHLVWNSQQVKDILDRYDDDNGIVKVEITHGFEPGKKCYRVEVWRYPRIESPELLDANKEEGEKNER